MEHFGTLLEHFWNTFFFFLFFWNTFGSVPNGMWVTIGSGQVNLKHCSIGLDTGDGHLHKNDLVWWADSDGKHCGIAESFVELEIDGGRRGFSCVLKECTVQGSCCYTVTPRILLVDIAVILAVTPYVVVGGGHQGSGSKVGWTHQNYRSSSTEKLTAI